MRLSADTDQSRMRIALDPDLRERLDMAAEDRGISPVELATRLLSTALRDDMLDAILDDGAFA